MVNSCGSTRDWGCGRQGGRKITIMRKDEMGDKFKFGGRFYFGLRIEAEERERGRLSFKGETGTGGLRREIVLAGIKLNFR